MDFLAANVHDLADAAEDPKIVAAHLDLVAGVEPAVAIEWSVRIQVSPHRRSRSNLEDAIVNAGLESLATQLDPQRIRCLGLRSENAQLRQPIRLAEFDQGKGGVDSLQRGLGHWLGSIGDHPKR